MTIKTLHSSTMIGKSLVSYNLDNGDSVVISIPEYANVATDKTVTLHGTLDPIDELLCETFTIDTSNSFTLTRQINSNFSDTYTFPITYDSNLKIYRDATNTPIEEEHLKSIAIGYIRNHVIFPISINKTGDVYEVEFDNVIGRWPGEDIVIGINVEPVFIEIDSAFIGFKGVEHPQSALKFTASSDNTNVWAYS